MSNLCPYCGAESMPVTSASGEYPVMWICRTDKEDDGKFSRNDTCRVRELEQQCAKLENVVATTRKLRLCFPNEAPSKFDIPRYIIEELDVVLNVLDNGEKNGSISNEH